MNNSKLTKKSLKSRSLKLKNKKTNKSKSKVSKKNVRNMKGGAMHDVLIQLITDDFKKYYPGIPEKRFDNWSVYVKYLKDTYPMVGNIRNSGFDHFQIGMEIMVNELRIRKLFDELKEEKRKEYASLRNFGIEYKMNKPYR